MAKGELYLNYEDKIMNDDQREIKVLKKLVKAQNKIILAYRLGRSELPEWVFSAIDDAKSFYEVNDISSIK